MTGSIPTSLPRRVARPAEPGRVAKGILAPVGFAAAALAVVFACAESTQAQSQSDQSRSDRAVATQHQPRNCNRLFARLSARQIRQFEIQCGRSGKPDQHIHRAMPGQPAEQGRRRHDEIEGMIRQ